MIKLFKRYEQHLVFILLLLAGCSALVYINVDKNDRVRYFLENAQKSLQIHFNTIYENYRIASNNIHISLLQEEAVTRIMDQANGAGKEQKAKLRHTLYGMLAERYERIKKFGVEQFHFHLKNNESFLRLHKPEKFGDNLSDIRYSVRYTNANQKPVEGFETGRIVHGFRFVYPLFHDSRHVGSVEISMSSRIFQATMENSFKNDINIILKKDVVLEKLWKEELHSHYKQSKEHPDYLQARFDENPHTLPRIRDVSRQLQKGRPFSIYDPEYERVVSFLPLRNIREKKVVGYIVSYSPSSYIPKVYSDYYTLTFSIIGVLALLFYFLKKDFNYKRSLRESVEQKTAELKTANTQLQERIAEINHLINGAMEAIMIYKDGGCIDCNSAAVQMFSADDKIDLLQSSLYEHFPRNRHELLRTRTKAGDTESFELTALTLRGEEFPVLMRLHEYTKGGHSFLVTTVMDLSDLKEKEKTLMHQNRLAQMGEMISMIAHQWRQPLTAISSTANTLYLKTSMDRFDKGFFTDRLEKIATYSQHLSSTIDDFRNFFKRHKEQREITLEELCDDSISIIETSLQSKGIELYRDYRANTKLLTYPNELRQVVLNLLKNAEDILIESKKQSKWITVKTRILQNGELAVIVGDNGGGIKDAIMEKIFDPYFSTKTGKDGTGLGLYMSKTIVEDHCNGTIRVRNTTEGAEFTIALATQ